MREFHAIEHIVLALIVTLLPAVGLAQSDKELHRAIPTPGVTQSQNKGKLSEAEQRRRDDLPELYRVEYSSAPEPIPALKYRLYPSRGELQPGNSVPFYYRAILEWDSRLDGERQEFFQLMDDMEEKRLSDLLEPKLKARIERETSNYALDNLKIAAYRNQTTWDWQVGRLENQDPYSFIIQETQSARGLSRLIDVKTRLLAAEGRIEEALELHKQHFKLARDLAQQPFSMSTFVAYSQVSIGSHNLKDIITQTNCPNLYWALATIPEPFVSIEEVLENEASLAEKSFPILREPEHTDRSVEGWSRLMRETIEVLVAFGAVYDHPIIDPALVGFAVSIRSYPIAKRELITLGWKQEKLEKMPVGQVVAIYQKHITLSLFDEALKWSYLPDLELKNSERLRREQDRLNQERKKQSEPFPIATTLLPAHAQLRAAALRSKSRIHGLMVLEAIRMHAAENHGQLPQSLDEITVVPVPKECPLTGEPFEYRTTKGDAFLIVPTVPENIGRRSWWEFQLKNAERTQEKR